MLNFQKITETIVENHSQILYNDIITRSNCQATNIPQIVKI